MGLYCGIDFGTSNSALAVATSLGRVELARSRGSGSTLPSAIFYPEDELPRFGVEALDAFIDGEDGRLLRSLKRILGTSLMTQGTEVNRRRKRFEDIVADFIRHIKTSAEKQFGTALEHVVMGRPVHFVDGDPEADLRAQTELEGVARAVGFRHVEFQYEPIAAAFAHERRLLGPQLALVVDIGGGTSDFTVIRLGETRALADDRRQDILSSAGVRVGGNDLDKALSLAAFMPLLGYKSTYGEPEKGLILPTKPFFELAEWSRVNTLYTPRNRALVEELLARCHDKPRFGRYCNILRDETGHELLAVVEDNKIALTEHNEIDSSLDFIEKDLSLTVQRTTFDEAIKEHVERISACIDECLHQAEITHEKIALVILTGGTTEVPGVKATVCARFPTADISDGDKLSSVGMGLGYDSIRRFS